MKANQDNTTSISWRAPDEKLLTPAFKIRRKEAKEWRIVDNIAISSDAHSVTLSNADYPVDWYEYELDFYFKEEDGTCGHTPSYRSLGEVLLDTGNNQDTDHLVWYMSNDTTLVLTGKLDDVMGVELLKKGQPVKRLSGTKENNKLVIDLSNEVSGDYTFKALKHFQLITNKDYAYRLEHYQPSYQLARINSQETYFPLPGTLPPQITAWTPYAEHLPPIPYGDYNYNNPSHYYKTVWGGLGLPWVRFFGRDDAQQEFYLGSFVSAPTPTHEGCRNYYQQSTQYLPLCYGKPFSLLSGLPANIHALLTADGNSYQVHPWAGGSYQCMPSHPLTQVTGVLSLEQSEAGKEVLGEIKVRTKFNQEMTGREISLNNFSIQHHTVSGYFYNQIARGTPRSYYYFNWDTNVPNENQFLLFDTMGQASLIPNMKGLSKTPRVKNFQFMWPNQPGPTLGPLNISVGIIGDVIPLGEIRPQSVVKGDGSRAEVTHIDSFIEYDGVLENTSYYPDAYSLYFCPVPTVDVEVAFEYIENTILNGKEARTLPVTKTTKGWAIPVKSVAMPGEYSYRFLNAQTKEPLDLSSVGVEYQNGVHGKVVIRKGQPHGTVFVSKSAEQLLTIRKLAVHAQHDRRRNRTQVTNRSGQTTDKIFNLFNQETKTIEPEVPITNAQGEESRGSVNDRRTLHYAR